MMFDSAPDMAQLGALINPNSALWKLTPNQVGTLFLKCKNAHGGGGGGGGGGGAGGTGGGQWVFWQPVLYGPEGNAFFGAGQWIWWPGGGISRMSVY
jgi:hypothetical protein